MANPFVDSTHLSDQAKADMIDNYGGVVDSQFAKQSIVRGFVNVKPLRGTDTMINRRFGKTDLQAVVPGVRPDATKTEMGKVAVSVDRIVLARDVQSTLNTFQSDVNVQRELGIDHGKQIGKKFDEACFIQAIKGAALPAPAGLNGAFTAGKVETLGLAGDELDPLKLYAAIAKIIVAQEEDEMDAGDGVCVVSPTQYDVLTNHDKLIDRKFSVDNGDFATGTFQTIKGMAVVKSTRIPKAAITNHVLGTAYNLTAAEAKVSALVMHPKSILAAETIPLTSKVWYSDSDLSWYIDSYLAFGFAPNLPQATGIVKHL